ncbi:MAG: phage terminase large subunit [Clostridiaceae bacterium]|nr:phage terminase large subunit [Clostridiaceae bacterium]
MSELYKTYLELVKTDYAAYVQYVHRGRWIPGKHLLFICQKVQDFIETETGHPYDILILQMPPQHGKSMAITETLPSWFLGRWPEKRVIEASYNEAYAQRFGRRTRDKIKEFCGDLFGIEISKDKDSNNEFELSNGIGGMISRGIMSGITGNPAELIIIDDPIKNREEADSENNREKQWDEWQNSIKTRCAAGAKVIVIMTRWHEDDLAGRMQIAEKKNFVTSINLPCEAEENDPLGREIGDPLFPEIGKNKEWLRQFKQSYINDPNNGGTRAWLALFQGRPSAQEGSIFKRHWWKYWKPKGIELPPVSVRQPDGTIELVYAVDLPDKMDRKLQSWDMTFKDSDGTDLVACGVWGSYGANIFKLDLLYERLDFVNTVKAFETMCKKWPEVTTKLVEDKANGPAVISMLRNKISGIVPIEPEGSKVARASAVSVLCESGNVYLPHPMLFTWVNSFIEQLAKFPNDVHDDMVDETSQALKRLMYAREHDLKHEIPDDLPDDLKKDLINDPQALQHWLKEHGRL